MTTCFTEENGVVVVDHTYHDRAPIHCEFTGTPLTDRHGGWDGNEDCVEYHHTLADIMTSAIDAGFRLDKFYESEPDDSDPNSGLPSDVAMLWVCS